MPQPTGAKRQHWTTTVSHRPSLLDDKLTDRLSGDRDRCPTNVWLLVSIRPGDMDLSRLTEGLEEMVSLVLPILSLAFLPYLQAEFNQLGNSVAIWAQFFYYFISKLKLNFMHLLLSQCFPSIPL